MAESEKHDGARAFDERGAATYMQQILGAMSYLHKNNFVHRETGLFGKKISFGGKQVTYIAGWSGKKH